MSLPYSRLLTGLTLLLFVVMLLVPLTTGLVQAETATSSPLIPASDGPAFVVSIDEEIKAGTAQFIERTLRQAASEGASLYLIELETPGGLLSATNQITRALTESPVPTAVYVARDTGQAFSAGVFIMLAADVAASHPNAVIGAAAPILATGGDADEKVRNATLAQIESLAARNDRDPEVVGQFVLENLTMNGVTALSAGVVDVTAADRSELLTQLGLEGAEVVEVQPNMLDATLSFLSIPFLVPLLLTLGSLGLFFAFRTGEIEIIGVLSFILLLLGLWGVGTIQLSTLGVVILIIGIGLVILEIFLAGSDFGISGIFGLVAILFGIITFAQEPLFPDIVSSGFLPILIAIFAGAGILMFAITYFTASAVRQPHRTGVETMVGQVAIVKQELAPQGVIWFEGERYTARSQSGETLPSGQQVIIVAMEGNVAVVQKSE